MNDINISKYIFAQRGLQLKYPENSLRAYKAAEKQNFGIHMNVRVLNDGTYICFKNTYMKRLLNFPGRVCKKTYEFLRKLNILNTNYKIPTVKKVLKLVKNNVPLLIQLNGGFSKENIQQLINICKKEERNIFFCTSNIVTFLKFKTFTKEKIHLLGVKNKIEFLKVKKYKKFQFIPEFDDIIVEAEDRAKSVIQKIHKAFNQYNTRVTKNHWLLKYNGKKFQIMHRAIASSNVKEHSKEGILECISKKKVPEIDVVLHKGKLICYHSDKVSSKLGQESSIAEKINIENSILFEDVLKLVDGKVPIIIDIKDYHLKKRLLEEILMEKLKGYNGKYCVQSFNPLVLRWFLKNYPEIIRGQVGNSFSNLSGTRNIVLLLVNFILFYSNKSDYIVYDLDKYVSILSKFNNILGLPVIGYTAHCLNDIDKYKELYFNNIIVEGDFLD